MMAAFFDFLDLCLQGGVRSAEIEYFSGEIQLPAHSTFGKSYPRRHSINGLDC